MAARSGILGAWAPRLMSVLRLVAGLLYLEHGTMKLLNFPPSDMFGHVRLASMIGAAGVLELVGGALIAVGLFTRSAAFILSGQMAFAYFIAHYPKGFYPALNGGEPAILYCVLFLFLAAAGAGPWSLDAWARKVR